MMLPTSELERMRALERQARLAGARLARELEAATARAALAEARLAAVERLAEEAHAFGRPISADALDWALTLDF